MRCIKYKNMKYLFFLFLLVFTCLFRAQAQAQVDPKDLSHAVKKRILRVPEFSFIKEEADKLGVKVYLFGGTASAFGHYVRWDLERETGDKKYQKERFDYDFTNIYRGNQDLDIVVDGTAKQALVLKQILKEKYPHFVGDKESWEVRLLRDQIGRKSALLNDPDFLNQHTDTNSTGMIAIDDQGDDDDFVFRDLFSWDEEESAFLKDVSSARITFLYSKTHNETTRYKEGKNPPIFAAVRYLAKLAQYELKGLKEDLDIIKEIIKETNWSNVQNNSYVKYKLEEFGKKVLLNAPNLEYAWNLLEDTGLRKELIEMDENRIRDEGTLSWWMNKEPLRSKPIGLGHGRRAEEIFLNQMDENADNKNADKNGEIILSHETSDFKAYENITRSSRGEANAFISREGIVGESAILGDGFYTKLGFKGARGTNLTIRFKLNLKAREGSDFIYNRKGVVILRNKKAITLMQENINITLKDFIKLILNGGIEEQDLGLIEKMKRKFKRKVFENDEIDEAVLYFMEPSILKSISKKSWILYLLPTMEKSKHFDLLLKELVKNKEIYDELLEHFFSQEVSVQYEEQLDFIINNLESKAFLIEYFFSRKYWKSKRSLIDLDKIIQEGKTDEIFAIIKYVLPNEVNRNWFLQISELEDEHYNSSLITYVLSQSIWKNNGDLITKFLSNDYEYSSFSYREELINRIVGLLMLPHWRKDPNWYSWAKKLIERKEFSNMLLENFLFSEEEEEEESVQYEEQLDFIINNLKSKALLIKYFFSTDSTKQWWKSKRSLIDLDKIIQKGKTDEIGAIIKYVLPNEEVDRKWFSQIIELKGGYYNDWVTFYVLSQPIWKNNGDFINWMVELLMLPHWRKNSDWYFWAEKLIEHEKFSNRLPEFFLSQEESVQYEEQLNFIINNLESKALLIKYFFSRKHWKSKRSLIDLDKIIQEGKTDEIFAIIKYVLPNEVNRNWFLQISELKDGYYDYWLVVYVLSQPIWKNNGDLITKLLENHYRKASIFNSRTSNDLTSINRIEIIELLMLPHWREHPEWHSWVEKILFSKDSLYWKNQQLQDYFIKIYLHSPHWNRQIDIINRLLDNPSNIREMAFHVFNLPHMLDHPYLIKKAILKSKHEDHWVSLSNVFKNKGWEKFPEILVMLIQKGIDANNIKNNIAKILRLNYFIGYPKNTVDIIFESNIVRVLKLDHWKNHPDLIAFTGKENFTIQDIYLKSKEQDFLDFQNNRNNRNNRNNKKISSREDRVLYSDNKKLHSSNEEETLYSGEKPYSASGGERTCTVLLN